MIFVTVGSQLPFDRLVHAVDAWAEANGRVGEVFAQVGATTAPPRSIPWAEELSPEAFQARVDEADIIVGHAGTGTIMASLCAGKPVVVLARRVALSETRNDHQVATIERFESLEGFHGSTDETEIPALLDACLELRSDHDTSAKEGAGQLLAPYAAGPLVERLRSFFDEALR